MIARLAAAIIVLCAFDAHASSVDVFGAGARSVAMGGTGAAVADDAEATGLNPAGLAHGRGARVDVGYGYALSGLRIDRALQRFSAPHFLFVNASAVLPLKGVLERRFAAGLSIVLPTSDLLRAKLHLPETPHFPLFENRIQRLVLRPALAARIVDGLSLGVALNYYVNLTGRVESREGPDRGFEPTAAAELTHSVSVDAGLRWDPSPRWSVAFAYRQAQSSRVVFSTSNSISDNILELTVTGVTLYEPHRFVLGGAFRLPERGLLFTAEGFYRLWSGWSGPFTRISARIPTGKPEPEPFVPVPLDVRFRDTWGAGWGIEWSTATGTPLHITARAGYTFETAALARQPAESMLFDGNKHRLGAGLVLDGRDSTSPRLAPWRFSLSGQVTIVESSLRTRAADGKAVSGGGVVGLVFASVGLAFDEIGGRTW